MDDVYGIPRAVAYRQFVTGFCYLDRAFRPVIETDHPGQIVHCHWPQEGRRGTEWTDEFFAWEADPLQYIGTIRSAQPGPNHFVTDGYATRGSSRPLFEAHGFTFEEFEPFMALDLANRQTINSSHIVETITDLELAQTFTAAQIAQNLSLRDTNQLQIDDPATILKIALVDGEPVAAGKGALIEDSLYVSDITTLPTHRKQGLAAAIMEALHQDAAHRGARRAILCASAMAANLYRSLGYQDIATVDLYLPPTHNPTIQIIV